MTKEIPVGAYVIVGRVDYDEGVPGWFVARVMWFDDRTFLVETIPHGVRSAQERINVIGPFRDAKSADKARQMAVDTIKQFRPKVLKAYGEIGKVRKEQRAKLSGIMQSALLQHNRKQP